MPHTHQELATSLPHTRSTAASPRWSFILPEHSHSRSSLLFPTVTRATPASPSLPLSLSPSFPNDRSPMVRRKVRGESD
ncbi:hypothetical protein E2C01_081796 [Portunus trituberculatus]|uniref:Uncharacterized protein n=1 Tax=Portunus trituberculatus TaxID=210409 RepID=A0A5B7IST2_PORTR|nr:hypothetical protein [Portunus trituberculatus]